MNTWRIAWRNIWRNSRRTAVTVVAVALCTALLIVTFGLMDGMKEDLVHNVTYLSLGDAQVHAEGYRKDRSIYKVIDNHQAIADEARRHEIDAARRAFGYGLLSSGVKSAGARFWGVEPEFERQVFDLAKNVDRGKFLSNVRQPAKEGELPVREIVLGRKLARSLKAEVGAEIVAVVQAADGSLGNELFEVKGILKSCDSEIDRAGALIHHQDFDELFVAGGRVHEIALNAHGKMTPQQVVQTLAKATKGQEVMTWHQLRKSFSDMISMFDGGMWIFAMIFFLAAGLGVMNTMLMATYDRMREFGVLKALGASGFRIMKGVTVEALVLGVFSSVIGLVFGALGNWYCSEVGIDLSRYGEGIMLEGVAYNTVWKSTFTAESMIMPMVVMSITCVLAALYPAIKAARLNPVRAMTHV